MISAGRLFISVAFAYLFMVVGSPPRATFLDTALLDTDSKEWPVQPGGFFVMTAGVLQRPQRKAPRRC